MITKNGIGVNPEFSHLTKDISGWQGRMGGGEPLSKAPFVMPDGSKVYARSRSEEKDLIRITGQVGLKDMVEHSVIKNEDKFADYIIKQSNKDKEIARKKSKEMYAKAFDKVVKKVNEGFDVKIANYERVIASDKAMKIAKAQAKQAGMTLSKEKMQVKI